jgi:hypothetical protein
VPGREALWKTFVCACKVKTITPGVFITVGIQPVARSTETILQDAWKRWGMIFYNRRDPNGGKDVRSHHGRRVGDKILALQSQGTAEAIPEPDR